MPRVILTGGPGVGKTTLLRSLAAQGHPVVEESARSVIKERLASGLPPRPDAISFAAEVLRRDIEKYKTVQDSGGWIFFDRSALESAAMLLDAQGASEDDYSKLTAGLDFHVQVLLLPPWREIYSQDAERDHTFDHCVRVHESLVRFYSGQGFQLLEVPPGPVEARTSYALRTLAHSDA